MRFYKLSGYRLLSLNSLAMKIHYKGTENFHTCLGVRATGESTILYNKIMAPYGLRSTPFWMQEGKAAIECPIERNEVRQNLVLLYQEFLNGTE